MFGSLGVGEIILIFLVILILFGTKRIPDIAQGLGKAFTEFKKAMQNVEEEINKSDKEKGEDKK
jgi:sec-independent protein translocase protein TatA